MKYMKKLLSIVAIITLLVSLFVTAGCGEEKKTGTIKIYIVRHGQTEANEQGILCGSGIDSMLTDFGKEQAKLLGTNCNIKFDDAYSSMLTRTYDTAQTILEADNNEIEITKLEDLNDISWGKAEGLTWEETVEKYGVQDFDECFGDVDDEQFESPIEAESKWGFCDRFEQAMKSITEQSYGKNSVLVVTHSAADFWLGKRFPDNAGYGLENVSLTTLEYNYDTETWSLLDYNNTSYIQF